MCVFVCYGQVFREAILKWMDVMGCRCLLLLLGARVLQAKKRSSCGWLISEGREPAAKTRMCLLLCRMIDSRHQNRFVAAVPSLCWGG